MTHLSIAYVATAAVCVLVALQHLMVAYRVPERRLHLLFALAAIGVAGDALVSRALYLAQTAEHFQGLMPLTTLCIGAVIVSLSWFIVLRTDAPRLWPVMVVSALWVVTLILDFSVGVSFTGPIELRQLVLPWGEGIVLPVGDTNPLRLVADLFLLSFLLILVESMVRMYRTGDRRSMRVLGGSLVLFSLGLFSIIPFDLGWLPLPSLHTFTFLLIVAAMSWDLSEDLIRASRLSREVVANERRWRQLLRGVQLLAARIDRDGQVVDVNPLFTEVTGYTTEDAAGRAYWDFVAPEQREERRAAFGRAMEGDPTREVEVTTTAKDGQAKRINWRNVLLRDADGEIEGMLSIGADITDRIVAEAERDRALKELQVLKDRLEEENVYLREEIRAEHGFKNIVGGSDPLLYVLHKVRQVAPGDTSVLILGETGVGKELIARTIHAESPRSSGPFVVINCAALPPNLIESELFGHERGAFTGADRQRRGRFELAHGGTLFLDEVGELPLEMQPKLLRVLQEGQLERVGGTETISVDVRVIAATNRDLNVDMEAGRFREDLFYRIAVYPITVPRLGDRREDIPLLVEHFVQHFAQRRGRRIDEIPAEVMRRLRAYDWPGNVRELQNVIERAILTTTDRVLRLAEPLQSAANAKAATRENGSDAPALTLDEVERRYIVRVLEKTEGQISGGGGAAEILGLHANTLRYRLKKLGITVGRKTGAITVDS
jgi:PAS domain S-box-containing protein